MAHRRVRRTKGTRVTRRTPETLDVSAELVEDVMEEEELVEEETAPRRRRGRPRKQPVAVEEIVDEVAEEETAAPAKRRRGRPRKKPVAEVVEEIADEEPVAPKRKRGRPRKEPVAEVVEEETAAPVKRKRGRPRKKKVAEVVEEEPVADTVVAEGILGVKTEDGVIAFDADWSSSPNVTASSENVVDAILAMMDTGKTITIAKIGSKYVLSTNADKTPLITKSGREVRAMTTAQMLDIALTEEYKEFSAYWSPLTYEEKAEEADDEGIEWDEHDNARVNNMSLTKAVRAARGIEKWKHGYEKKAARDALLFRGEEVDA